MRKTVVELDLVGYSTVARLLEEAAGPQSVAALNDQIQKFIDHGLQTVQLSRQKTVIKTTGDGAILVFDRASDAHKFAVAVHDCTQIHNSQRKDPLTKRWFRIGIATGEIAMQTLDHGGYEIAGTTVAIAVRLETACHPGAILIDRSTFELLDAAYQGLYGEEEAIAGKRDERFHGRRCRIAEEADPTASDPRMPRVLKQMAEAARPVTQQFVRRVTSHGVFNPDVYGERHDVRLHLATFLDGNHPGMFLFGTSGVGKTCFVAARATEWLLNLSSENLVLAYAAETLSASVPELESTLVRGLGLKPPFGEAIREVQAACSDGGSPRVLMIFDGLERHPQPQRMIDAVLGLADSLREVPAFRLLATCSLSAFQVRDRESRLKTKGIFYVPQRGLLVDEDEAVPGVVLGGLASEELENIYERYRAQPNTRPTTPFELLSEETRQMLSHPVLLRMAMEVFDARDVPAGLFSGAMLQEFAAQKIMSSPRKSAVIAQVVDLMMAQHRRALPLSLLWDEFRPAPQEWEQWNQVLLELVDDQVLTLTSRDVFPGLPLPPELSIEFTFERLFEYLIAWRLIARHEDLQEMIQRGLVQGPHLGTVRGAIVFLLVHLMRISAIDEVRAIYQHASEKVIDQLLHDALVELLVGMGTTEDESSGLHRLLTELFETHPARTERLLSHVGETLFVRGSWDAAHDVVRLAATLSVQDAVAATRMRNRLVLLCKNMDRWPEALHESDQCLATVEAEIDPNLSCRIDVNRGSVLYDLGKRNEAAEIFQRAMRWAEKGQYPQGFATAANNLGLYYLYHDELAQAEAMFQKANAQIGDGGLITAYILNNLGLVKWTRGLTEPVKWDEAEQLFDQALTRFRHAGHVQGMSYALSNRGLCELFRGHLAEAEEAFRKTQDMSQRLGEKWTAYGASANLALVQLAQPVPNYDETFHLACDVRTAARENNDPKGIADASLIASRVALDWLVKSGAPAALREETRQILEEARQLFHDLGQRLGEALSCFGLRELAAICEQPNEAKDQEVAGRRLLRETQLEDLPPRLIALPWHMLLLTELF